MVLSRNVCMKNGDRIRRRGRQGQKTRWFGYRHGVYDERDGSTGIPVIFPIA